VGAMIFTVLMIAGFSALSVAMDTQTDIVKTHLAVADIELKKQQENFDISVFTRPTTNILNVTVSNSGQNPVEISKIWIVNKTLAAEPAYDFTINSDDAIVPTGSQLNILNSQNLKINPETYDVKVVSSLGTIKTQELTVGSSSSILRAKLVTDPPDVILGQNVTIAMLVTNTASATIENVTPVPGSLPTQVTASSSPTPASADLGPGESVLFSWDYALDGIDGTSVTFSGSANGDYDGTSITSNTSSDVSMLREDETGTGGPGGDPDPLSDELLARPQLFLVIPGPQGDSSKQALWGVNIVNPVDVPMTVSKLTITAFAPGANNNDKIFTAGCGPATNIFPLGTNYWTCPTENLLMWESYSAPVTIPEFSSQQFLVRVTPGAIAGVNHLESIIVQASVFTNVGSFGKSGYQTTMYDGSDTIGSIYLSSVTDSRTNSDMSIARTGITSGSSAENFKVVFADLDTDSATYVKAGGKLVINVPKEWSNVAVVSNPGFTVGPPVIHGDGSTQITGILNANLGTATNQADTIEFTAQAPTVTSEQMYVMYLLAEGETETGATDFAMGASSEVVLQVIP
jgi:hypothetical protein